jgi:hypothetical protein
MRLPITAIINRTPIGFVKKSCLIYVICIYFRTSVSNMICHVITEQTILLVGRRKYIHQGISVREKVLQLWMAYVVQEQKHSLENVK